MSDSAPWWLALVLAGTIVVLAWRAGSLRGDGALAALCTGTIALHRAYGWGLFLVTWFVLASALSRVGRQRKAARTSSIVAKGERRDAWQVLANGGVFAACALWSSIAGGDASAALALVAVGALTAAGADTWGTEIGTLWGGEPWSLRDRRRVASGTSGAVTLPGSTAVLIGALLLAQLSSLLGVVPQSAVLPVAIAGVGGAWADTLVGAFWQERRWCAQCQRATERAVHDCGAVTAHRGGWQLIDNDAVNAGCTLVGGLLAPLLANLFA